MIPTIDISLIGIVGAIWVGLKAIAHYFSVGLQFVLSNVVAFIAGSRLWCTIFFVAAVAALVVLYAYLIRLIMTNIASFAVSLLPHQVSTTVAIMARYFPFDPIFDLISSAFGGLAVSYTVQNYALWYIKLQGVYSALSRAFKL